ncbi:site-specific integrase [Dehalococcoidia bacterium]|nr:site-specific integrase [Dehalococcoidia bacterium]
MKANIRITKGIARRITITFPYNPVHVAKIKAIEGSCWHPEEKQWTVPYSEEMVRTVLSIFEGDEIELDPALQTFLERIKKKDWLEELRWELIRRKYSQRTIKLYLYYNWELLKRAGKPPQEITNSDVKDYLLYLADEKEASASTLHGAINALKFYYSIVLKKRFFYEIERPRKDKKLPVILSREEVSKVLSAPSNLKHRAILMLTYSAGLRVSEVAKLKVGDIDSGRRLIRVKGGKGRKDRYTILSEVTLKTLEEYTQEQKPEGWLFPGQREGRYITTRTVEKVFENACRKAGIKKEVSVHSLRHSFATHLLEEGVDIRYIQEILGHKSSKTTEIYTHVALKDIKRIKSPLGTLMGEK